MDVHEVTRRGIYKGAIDVGLDNLTTTFFWPLGKIPQQLSCLRVLHRLAVLFAIIRAFVVSYDSRQFRSAAPTGRR